MSINSRVAKVAQKTGQLSAQIIAQQVREIMGEVRAGKFPDYELLSPILNVGQCLSVPNFEKNATIVNEITAAFLGRTCRAIALKEGVDVSTLPIDKIMQILTPTDAVQLEVVAIIIQE